MPNPAAAPATDLKDTLEEMRASVAARGARKGIRGAIQEAILGFLETLLALLAEFRAGRLAAPACGESRRRWRASFVAGFGAVAPPPPQPTGSIRVRPADGGKPARQGGGRRNADAGQATLVRASLRSRRFKVDHRAHPAAGTAVAGCARHSPRFPALRVGIKGGVERADSKNGVLGAGDSGGLIVPA